MATAYLGSNLDLRNIALRARNVEYNPRRFAACIMRLSEPKSTSLVFASGKLVCTGAKSEELCNSAVKKITKAIKRIGYSVKLSDLKI